MDSAIAPADTPETVIGLDIGASKIHGAAFGFDLEPLAEVRLATDVASIDTVADAAVEAISRLVPRPGLGSLVGIGIGIPGRVDHQRGVVRHAVNLGVGDEPVDIARRIGKHFSAPLFLENDVNAAALGAFEVISRDLDIESLTYLSIGSGIAAGVILNGDILRGARGVAGEIGHFPMARDGPECACGIRGCLESVASGRAIDRLWRDGRNEIPAVELFAAATAGDEEASSIVAEVAGHLARAVYLLAVTYDTDRTVIGGGVADTGSALLDAISAEIIRLEAESQLVASLDLSANLMLNPSSSVGPIGAATVARRRLARGHR